MSSDIVCTSTLNLTCHRIRYINTTIFVSTNRIEIMIVTSSSTEWTATTNKCDWIGWCCMFQWCHWYTADLSIYTKRIRCSHITAYGRTTCRIICSMWNHLRCQRTWVYISTSPTIISIRQCNRTTSTTCHVKIVSKWLLCITSTDDIWLCILINIWHRNITGCIWGFTWDWITTICGSVIWLFWYCWGCSICSCADCIFKWWHEWTSDIESLIHHHIKTLFSSRITIAHQLIGFLQHGLTDHCNFIIFIDKWE